ncbi:MAG TPA: primosomal protein N', partial [Dehalococcoidia bacterium]|nr:primosomal protein N' [Dehalococcoidia bacterium]
VVAYLRLALPKEALERAYSSLQRAPRQQDLLQLLEASPEPIPLPELRATFSAATIDPLVARGFVASEERVIYRDPLASRVFEVAPSPPLTTQQEVAWEEVRAALESGRSATFLLHGITGSGKTEVYLRALAHAVAQGRRGIVLVPEIALTPQMVRRFASRFPERVAVFHSALSSGELFDEWWRTKNGEFDVAIGSRSALFAPQSPLGLIVLDEEHEWTYKEQEQSPRYHARDVALRLAELTGAVVILGSATPDLVSYHEARRGRHRFLALPERYHQKAELPEVRLIDLRAELREGNRSIFSRALQGAMAQALERREQVILFLNRRGSASFVQCRDCGHVLRCRRCEAPLTYHSAEEDLACHLCNLRRGIPRTCPNCRSPRIRYLGIGTQRVEEEVRKAFPQARTLRWDRDVTQGRHSHEAILDRFSAHEADVLIGTQMVAKGLDLPLVTLVGVINADIGLHLPDFRSAERTFQLLTQVAGRAGRGTLPGQVVIQSYNPDHYAVQAVLRHDYEGFYRREASFRRSHGYPPFGRLVRLLFSHSNYARSQAEAQRLGELLREAQDYHGLSNIDLIGPVPCYTHRLRGRYRWQIVLRGDEPERLLEQAAVPSGWQVDVDPVSLL